ncbi:mechanosensitive ion channel family protein [Silvibacterium sp.]|uniref:mechanosensitive ion channel family protein n=1 Tax=Silvibacterium sp. TaxID=1964179 RepID=UPI0039E699C0
MWKQIQQALQDSMSRVTTKIAMLLPGILAFIVAMLIFLVLGWLFSWLVRTVLTSLRFDDRLRSGSETLAEWSPTSTPTTLATRIVFWVFVALGVFVGVSAFDAASAEPAITTYVFPYLPHIFAAVLLLFIGNVAGRFLARSVLITAVNLNLQYARLLSTGVKWLVLILTTAMALDHLSIGGQIVDLAFGILFGGIVLALALAIGLGSRDLVSRSLERESARPVEPVPAERLQHF